MGSLLIWLDSGSWDGETISMTQRSPVSSQGTLRGKWEGQGQERMGGRSRGRSGVLQALQKGVPPLVWGLQESGTRLHPNSSPGHSIWPPPSRTGGDPSALFSVTGCENLVQQRWKASAPAQWWPSQGPPCRWIPARRWCLWEQNGGPFCYVQGNPGSMAANSAHHTTYVLKGSEAT